MNIESTFVSKPDVRWQTSDYFLLSVALLIPVGVGTGLGAFYKRWRRPGRYSPSEEYFFGRQNISTLLLALSINTVFISAIAVQGFAEEVYFKGPAIIWLLLPELLAILVTALVFAPIYHTLNVTSIFNYLGLRFNRTVRLLASGLFIVQSVIVVSIALYAPAKLAEELHDSVEPWMVILVIATATGIYTAFGGFRTVVYTSVLQWLVVLSGLVFVIAVSALRAGGLDAFLLPTSFSQNHTSSLDALVHAVGPNQSATLPHERHSIWALSIGGFFTFLAYISVNQTAAHRYMTTPLVKSRRDSDTDKEVSYLSSTWAILACFAALLIPMNILFWLFGLVLRHHGAECTDDPHVLANFLLAVSADKVGWHSGTIFVAVAFTASISSLSCTLNSLSLLVMEDFVLPHYVVAGSPRSTGTNDLFLYNHSARIQDDDVRLFEQRSTGKRLALPDHRIVWYAKLTVLLATAIIALTACSIPLSVVSDGGYLLEFSLLIISAFGGPILGVFLGGLFIPVYNAAGAMFGFILALLVNGYLLGVALWTTAHENETNNKTGCTNQTSAASNVVILSAAHPSEVLDISPANLFVTNVFTFSQQLSYILLSAVGVAVTLLVGFIVSLMAILCSTKYWCCGHGISRSCPQCMRTNKMQRHLLWWRIMERRLKLRRNRPNSSTIGAANEYSYVSTGYERPQMIGGYAPAADGGDWNGVRATMPTYQSLRGVGSSTTRRRPDLPLTLTDNSANMYAPQVLMQQIMYEPSPRLLLSTSPTYTNEPADDTSFVELQSMTSGNGRWAHDADVYSAAGQSLASYSAGSARVIPSRTSSSSFQQQRRLVSPRTLRAKPVPPPKSPEVVATFLLRQRTQNNVTASTTPVRTLSNAGNPTKDDMLDTRFNDEVALASILSRQSASSLAGNYADGMGVNANMMLTSWSPPVILGNDDPCNGYVQQHVFSYPELTDAKSSRM